MRKDFIDKYAVDPVLGYSPLANPLFGMLIYLALIGISALVLKSQGYLIEDIQSQLFPIAVIMLFLVTRRWRAKLPLVCFLAVILIWFFYSFRIPIMREFGFFDGRIVLGRFAGDEHGYQARKLLNSLKVLGLTYDLPGPSIIPLNEKELELDAEVWFRRKMPPALLVFGKEAGWDIVFPLVEKDRLSGIFQQFSPSEAEGLPIYIAGYDIPFVLPSMVDGISLPSAPEAVMEHYLSWLAAYFHAEIALNPLSRIDVINEAASVGGPWKNEVPKALARYLFSYQEILELQKNQVIRDGRPHRYFEVGERERYYIEARLYRALSGLENEPRSKLYADVLTCYALSMVLTPDYSEDGKTGRTEKATMLLEKLLDDPVISLESKRAALHNLVVLRGGS